MLTRAEFSGLFPDDLTAAGNPLWAYEDYIGVKSEFFVNIPCIRDFDRKLFWRWCADHLQGHVQCYASDGETEWWGFTHDSDVTIWMLRWAGSSASA